MAHRALLAVALLASTALSTSVSAQTTETKFSWSHATIGTNTALQYGYTGRGSLVAVFGSGINAQHKELNGQVLPTQWNGYTGVWGAPIDVQGHETFVAGIIAAKRDNTGMHGVAPDAQLLSIQVLNASNAMALNDSQLAASIQAARGRGARIMNNSWNSTTLITNPTFTASYVRSALPQSLMAWQQVVSSGGVVSFATGNEGQTEAGFYAGLPRLVPSLAPGWIAVTATGTDGKIASYANRCGVSAAWCMAAPGSSLISATGLSGVGSYGSGSGTSYAEPQVTGAIAVLQQRYPHLTPAQIRSILFSTANKAGIYADKAIYGQGLLNLGAALNPVGQVMVATQSSGTAAGATEGRLTLASVQIPFAMSKGLDALQVGVVDDYGRVYQMQGMMRSMQRSFDHVGALQAFGPTMAIEDGHVQNMGMSFAFETAGVAAGLEGESKFRMQADGYGLRLNMSSGFSPTLAFGAFGDGVLEGRDLIAPGQAGNPYMSFVQEAQASSVRVENGNMRYRFGAFHGKVGDTQGLAMDAVDPFSRPATASGVVGEVHRKFGDSILRLSSGFVSEEGSIFGAMGQGGASFGTGTQTGFVGIGGEVSLGGGFALTADYTLGMTQVQNKDQSAVSLSALRSDAASVGLVGRAVFGAQDRLGVMMSMPLAATAGRAFSDVAVDRDLAGNLSFMRQEVSVRATAREMNMQAFYATPTGKDSRLGVGLMARFNPDNQADAKPEGLALVRWSTQF